ncbi:unnamed protein product, partial [Tetraodon nigroviridis]
NPFFRNPYSDCTIFTTSQKPFGGIGIRNTAKKPQ